MPHVQFERSRKLKCIKLEENLPNNKVREKDIWLYIKISKSQVQNMTIIAKSSDPTC
jgi:hypothetical protein